MTSTATRTTGQAPAPGGNGGVGPELKSALTHGFRTGVAGLLELPGQFYRGVVRSSKTTPGKLALILTGLIALSLIGGLVSAIMVQDKRDTLTDVIEHREPVAVAAQQVYRALSDADATAASAFLSIGSEPPALRQRYEDDIAQAGAALVKAAADAATVPAVAEKVDTIGQSLPVYTGLVETARANNRQGFPAGASYLREASHLMRSTILPAAQDLYRIDTERLVEAQDDATGFPFFAFLVTGGLVAALLATQGFLRRRTNRVFNVGLVAATAAVAFGVLWCLLALVVQAVLVNSGQDDTEHADLLVRARIAALQARADETLTLVARGDGGRYEAEFARLAEALAGADGRGGLLAEAAERAGEGPVAERVADARRSASAWLAAHGEVKAANADGDYKKAVTLVVDDSGRDGSAAAFTRLDADLRAAIATSRQDFFDDTVNARRALFLLPFVLALLGVVAALGATVGIRDRLREYR